MTEPHPNRGAAETGDTEPERARADDRVLEEYLHRKSALSMGYRRVYIEAPPPELDRAIAARARRAARWLVPAILSAAIVFTLIFGLNFGVAKWVGMLKSADQTLQRQKQEREQQAERERMQAPIAVIVDPNELNARNPAREQWLAKIEALERAGRKAEAAEERKRFNTAYPDAAK